MKNRAMKKFWSILAALAACTLTACVMVAPSARSSGSYAQAPRPYTPPPAPAPLLDVTGISRIAVMPFQAISRDQRQTAQYAAGAALSGLQRLNLFTLVSSSEIERLRKNNENIENYVDALFSGQITRMSVNQRTEQGVIFRNGEPVPATAYTTEVELEFNYFFTRARDGTLIGPVSKKGSKRATEQDGYVSAETLCAAIVDEQLKNLSTEIGRSAGAPRERPAAETVSPQTTAAGRLEAVSAYASGEIRNVLPENAKVWIVNTSSDTITEAMADNLSSDFIKRGIGTVDRQNIKLIEAEQQFQMSGFVSDEDFVSIGNAAGANTIVTVGISGIAAQRRLRVRVVDIERGVLLMQSNTSADWNL